MGESPAMERPSGVRPAVGERGTVERAAEERVTGV